MLICARLRITFGELGWGTGACLNAHLHTHSHECVENRNYFTLCSFNAPTFAGLLNRIPKYP